MAHVIQILRDLAVEVEVATNSTLALADEAISLIREYASNVITWPEFVQGAGQILDGGHEERDEERSPRPWTRPLEDELQRSGDALVA